jgi:hypothetical protein
MGFYIFQLDKLLIKHRRGNIPDDDVVTFSVFVNRLDSGNGSGVFVAMVDNTTASTTLDHTVDGFTSYPVTRGYNISRNWAVGPLEIDSKDIVGIVYTGTNISDSQLDLASQKQDEIELKIVDYIAKKYVELIAGLEFGSDLASGISEAFDQAFKDPVGDLIGYSRQGPCDGPVFSGVVSFGRNELDQYHYLPPPAHYTLPAPPLSYASFTNSYTDAATHDSKVCGSEAETDVTFSVFKVSFVSVRSSLQQDRFGYHFNYPTRFGPGLRQYGTPRTVFSLKSLLGIRL